MINSQADMILEHLKHGYTITPIEALNKFRCMRLGARIWDLKKRGYKIDTEFVESGKKRYASYKLVQENIIN